MTLSNEAVYDEPTDSLMTTLSAANDTTFVEPETRKLPPIPVVHDDKDSVMNGEILVDQPKTDYGIPSTTGAASESESRYTKLDPSTRELASAPSAILSSKDDDVIF